MRDSSAARRLSVNALKSCRPAAAAAAVRMASKSSRSLIHQTNDFANALRRMEIW
jgi:hypothetical protein